MTRQRIIRTRASQSVIRSFLVDSNSPAIANSNVTHGVFHIDTRLGPATIQLPANPRNFQRWEISDDYWALSENNTLTIDLNGKRLNSLSPPNGNYVLTEPGTIELLHYDQTIDSWLTNEVWIQGSSSAPNAADVTIPEIAALAINGPWEVATNTGQILITYTDDVEIDVSTITPIEFVAPTELGLAANAAIALTPDTTGLTNGTSVVVPYDFTLPGALTFVDMYTVTSLSVQAAGTNVISDTSGNSILPGTAMGNVDIDLRATITATFDSDGATAFNFNTALADADARLPVFTFSDGQLAQTTEDLSGIVLAAGTQTIAVSLPATATEIDIQNARLTNLTGLENWPTKEKVVLSDNLLTNFPSGLFVGASSLDNVSVTNNNISVIPPEIANATALRSLTLTGNSIAVLPTEIASLTNLVTLIANTNQLTALPPEIGSLTSMRTFQANQNNITDAGLPAQLWALPVLQTLSLTGNQLTTIPDAISGLAGTLRRLFLGNNQIVSANITNNMALLTSLTNLGLDGNSLTSLPASVAGIASLISLNLYNQGATMTSAVVDQFLAALVAGQPWDASATINIGVSSPAPTAAGLADKTTLETGTPAHTVITN